MGDFIKMKTVGLPAPWPAVIARQPARRIPGPWTTRELAALLDVGRAAILMQVSRGKLAPVARTPRQTLYFTDGEVIRYLGRNEEYEN